MSLELVPIEEHNNIRLTSTVVDINRFSQILNIIIRRHADITAESLLLKGGCGIWDISSIVESLLCSMKQESLLRIHALRFAGRNVEELVVKQTGVFNEIGSVSFQASWTILVFIKRDVKT